MSKFCSNCGKELDENAVVCVKCGVAVNNFKVKTKQPGKGMSIASMVLGIVSIFYGICLGMGSIGLSLVDEFVTEFNKIEFEFGFAIGYNFLPLALAVTGLSLGIASTKKIKNGFNTTGIILSSITLVICIISILIITFS